MSDQPQRNVELKAHNPDPLNSIAVCQALDAVDSGIIKQRDTYFEVSNGRLKLREEQPGQAHLIQYHREDAAKERLSAYRIVEIADPETLRTALSEALGVKITVVKARHLFLWQGVRIHLDQVEGLGSFIELEAVTAPGSDLSNEYRLIEALRRAFAIADDQICAISYSDLLERALSSASEH